MASSHSPTNCGGQGTPCIVGDGEIDAARDIVRQTTDAELFLYPGNGHLFANNSLPSYDAETAALLTERLITFLSAR